MKAKYAHTNLIARDWRRLGKFYSEVFGCEPVPPERYLSGSWLEEGTGVPGADLSGVHLRLPGHGDDGPTLEVFEYRLHVARPVEPVANQLGYGHVAFEVEDVEAASEEVLAAGGRLLGKVVTTEVLGRGQLTFAYVRDPEGNIIELQRWT